MKSKAKLLIAYDGSKGALATLAGLKDAGLPANVEAHVLTIADVMPLPPESKKSSLPKWVAKPGHDARLTIQTETERASQIAQKGAQDLKKFFPKWKITSEGCPDSPAWGIIKKAEKMKADLVVIGAHSLNPIARAFLGSVAMKVASQVSCSVHIVRSENAGSSKGIKILAGLDGSKNSDLVIQEIASRQWPKGTCVHIVTAIDTGLASGLTIYGSPLKQWVQNNDRNHVQWVHRMAQASMQKLRQAGLEVSYLVKEGDPKQLLLQEAEKWKATCVFVGSRGLSGFEKVLLGSVSMAVAARAHASVEIIRPGKK